MANERDFEELLVRYPEIIEEGLRLIGRQVVVCGRRIDLLFDDALGQKLVVELKWGPIKDEHVGQIMYYQGALLSGREPVRTMLVGTRVPPAIQRSLDFNGIAFREIRLSTIIEFLRSKGEADLVLAFEAELPLTDTSLKPKPTNRAANRTKAMEAVRQVIGMQVPGVSSSLALFAPIKAHWLQKAFDCLGKENRELRFSSNSPLLGPALELKIDNVYFKATGDNEVSARARFASLETQNPARNRLPGSDETSEGWNARFYYGFCDLTRIAPMPVTSLLRYPSGKSLRNDVPGACIIYDVITA